MRKPRSDVKCTPEELERRRAYYYRPEVHARYKERAKDPAYRARLREYRNRPERKLAQAEYNRRKFHFAAGLFDQLMEAQAKKCAVCGTSFDGMNPKNIHSDHCHDTKSPRGILCHHCNLAEGHIRKVGLTPTEFLQRLSDYLESPPASRLLR